MSKFEIKKVELNTKELKNVIRHVIHSNRELQELGKKPVALNVEGPAGLGKTAVCHQIGQEMGLDTVRINLAELEDTGDLIGFPLRQFEMKLEKKKAVTTDPSGKHVTVFVPLATPVIEWVDEQAVEQYSLKGYEFTGNRRTTNCAPEWIAGKTKGILLILDDYSRAHNMFMQATMTLIDKQEYGSWKLPPDSHILLTTNPDDGEYLVTALDDAQKSRMTNVYLKWDADTWAEWAEREGIDSRAINFILANKEIVNSKVNPRALTNFFNLISTIPDFEKDLDLIQILGEGSIGTEATTMFTAFIAQRLDRLISPEDILYNPEAEDVVKRMKKLIIPSKDEYRNDIASILASRLINYAIVKAEQKKISKSECDRILLITAEERIFTSDVIHVIAKRLIANDKATFKPLLNHSEFTKILVTE